MGADEVKIAEANIADDAKDAAGAQGAQDAKSAADATKSEEAKSAADAKKSEEAKSAADAKGAKDGSAADVKGAKDAKKSEDPKDAEEQPRSISRMVTLTNPNKEILLGHELAAILVLNPSLQSQVAQEYDSKMYELKLTAARFGGFRVEWVQSNRNYMMDTRGYMWQPDPRPAKQEAASSKDPARRSRSRSRG
jgi:hypothetical protein